MKRFLTLACVIAASASYAQVWDSGSGLNWAIPDNSAGVSWTFTPTGVSGALTQFDIFLNPAHTWRADLIITLTDPAAHVVTLHNREGSSGDMISVFYADGGAADPGGSVNLDSNTTGILYAPSSGTIGALGQSAGNWTLFASDSGLADTGTIDRIRVHTAPVPEPMSMVVLGIGALALLRRRKAA